MLTIVGSQLNFSLSGYPHIVTLHPLRLRLTEVDKSWVALKKLIVIWKSDLFDGINFILYYC